MVAIGNFALQVLFFHTASRAALTSRNPFLFIVILFRLEEMSSTQNPITTSTTHNHVIKPDSKEPITLTHFILQEGQAHPEATGTENSFYLFCC